MDYWDRYRRLMQGRAAYRISTVDDARRLAWRRLPRAVFDYIDGGAGGESTMRANRSVIEAVEFRPQIGVTVGVPGPQLATTVLGFNLSMPLLLSPIGYTRMMEPAGDLAAARAAGKAGTIFTLSSMTGHDMTDVMAAAKGPAWFQLYFLGGRAGAEQLVERARKAGFDSLVVTMDTQITSNREREARHHMTPPLKVDLRTMAKMAPQVSVRLNWLADVAHDRFHLEIANAASLSFAGRAVSTEEALSRWTKEPARWEDFAWLREQWPGLILAKGVTTGPDAKRAVDAGADAIIVSNHGGRQLDCVPGALRSLTEVVEAVGPQVEVLVDSGFRRGQDVAKAIALGARAVMVGRPWAYGLAAAGEAGVDRVLSLFRDDLDRTMRLLGCASVANLDRSYVRVPPDW
jgi:isopentenyl diphosphate isomerase/L-lactate dehydrogenase-like FMN-dependent dehydrogenase